MSKREELRQMIQEYALKFGNFTLASGKPSRYIFDCKQITLNSRGARLLAEQILAILDPRTQAVGGMTLGADPIVGSVIALADLQNRPLTGFIVRKQRKDHGTSKRVEGALVEKMRVAILEDTATTGGTILETIQALKDEFNAKIIQVITMVDRLEGAKENLISNGYGLESLFTIHDFDLSLT